MDDEGVLEAARAIRPYLRQLVGPAADEFDRRIAELLNNEQAAAVRSLLETNETTGDFLTEVLDDAPYYRPPAVQQAVQQHVRRGGEGYEPPPGDIGPMLAGKYACPHGDYVWYRPAVGTPIPDCPIHGLALTPA